MARLELFNKTSEVNFIFHILEMVHQTLSIFSFDGAEIILVIIPINHFHVPDPIHDFFRTLALFVRTSVQH